MTRVGLFATPCGGSTYTTRCLKASGLRVGHESMQPDGTVCGFWAHPVSSKPKGMEKQGDPQGGPWDVLGTLVRHPLLVAETLPSIHEVFEFDVPWAHEDPILHCLRYWVETFAAAEKHILKADVYYRATVRVDSRYDHDMQDLCARIRIPYVKPSMPPQSRNRRWPRVSWKEWEDRDLSYARWGKEYVRQYNLEEPQ